MQINMEYTHLEASRFTKPQGNVNIHNNSNISDMSKSGDGITISFTFTSTYEPSLGFIKIDGNIKISDADALTEKAFSDWESKERKIIDSEFAKRLHNTIISNCIVEATLLSKEILLPPPSPLPKVSIRDKGERVVEGAEKKTRFDDTADYIR